MVMMRMTTMITMDVFDDSCVGQNKGDAYDRLGGWLSDCEVCGTAGDSAASHKHHQKKSVVKTLT